MKSSAVSQHHRPQCRQSGCLLKQDGMDGQRLAASLVQLLAGSPPESINPDCRCIEPRESCVRCALGVIEGGHAFNSGPEWKRLDQLGQWHRRRVSRRNRFWH